jgi:nitrogen regulatory protein PII
VIAAIVATARSGKVGEGKIFISTIEEVVRGRTGDIRKNSTIETKAPLP